MPKDAGRDERTGPKTWGPFTGRQLATMFVAIVVVAGFPIGAHAVTGSSVFVTDVHSGAHAAVDAHGNLRTVSGGGSVAVSGSVVANQPTTALYAGGPLSPGSCAAPDATCVKVAVPPAGRAIVVTAIHISTSVNNTPGTARLYLYESLNGTCDNLAPNSKPVENVYPGGLGNTDLNYPSGLPVGQGKALCVANESFPDLQSSISTYGYAVAATAVPAGS